MITSKTNKKIRVGIRAAVQKSNLDRGGENMKKKEQKKVLIQKGMTVGMIFLLLLVAEGMSEKRYLSDRSVGFQYKAGRNTEKYRSEK